MTLSTIYISSGDITGSPDSKVEIFDSSNTIKYTNIHKNEDIRMIPEFEISESENLKATVELFDVNQVHNTELRLFLREQDRAIHYCIFWFGVCGLLISFTVLLVLRKKKSF